MNRRRPSLRVSMLILVIGTAVLAPTVAGWLIYRDTKHTTIETAQRSLIAENASKARQISRRITISREALKLPDRLIEHVLGETAPSADGTLPELSRAFREMVESTPIFRELFFVDGHTGITLASSEPAQIGKDRLHDSYFREALGGTHVEPPFYDAFYGRMAIILAVPLSGAEPGSFGVLGGYLNIDGLTATIDNLQGRFETSQTYLLNRANLFVTKPASEPHIPVLRGGMERPYLDRCRAGDDGLATTTDFAGVPVYVAYSWLGGLDVCVVTQVTRHEIASWLTHATKDAVLFVAAFAVVIAAIGIAILLPINHSLERLRQTFGEFAGGDLSARMHVGGFKEFATIGQSFNDMAEKHESASAELVRARDAANKASRAKSRFVAAMSHEIRTPLNGVLGLIAIARERETAEEMQHDLENAAVAGEQLLFVVNQILDFSKVEAGKFTLTDESFCPAAVLQSVASVMAPQAAGKGLRFDLDLPADDDPPALRGDPGRLRQVIFNLLGNAVKFTEVGHVAFKVRYDDEADGRIAMTVEVQDTGPGIEESFRNKLFEEFEQADNAWTRQAGGTGLGLAIANRILLQMGSRLEFESAVGAGTLFHFRVLLPRGDAGELSTEETDVAPARPLRVLVAEDLAINRQVIRAFLEKRGHTVLEAADGQQCLDILRAEDGIEIVLMDVHMPVMDGLAATAQIKLPHSGLAHVPVVGLTANAFDEQRREYLAAGMDDCLAKPIDWKALERTLARLAGVRPTAPPSTDVPPGADDDVDTGQLAALADHLGAEVAEDILDAGMAKCRDLVWRLMQADISEADMQFQAHALKGVAGNIGLTALSELAGRIETAVHDGRPTSALVATLRNTLARQEAAVGRNHAGGNAA